jgi:hypothetical protein
MTRPSSHFCGQDIAAIEIMPVAEHGRTAPLIRLPRSRLATIALGAWLAVVDVGLRAAQLIGDGLYGVDIKETADGIFVVEVNDNPNIDHGIEDAAEKDQVWVELTRWFIDRLEA